MWSRLFFASAGLATLTQASPAANSAAAEADVLIERAFSNAPNGYTPATDNCPDSPPSIRQAVTLSQGEIDWLDKRRNVTVPAMQDFLSRIEIPDFDADAYFSSHASDLSALPNLGIAFSGGGWRALMNGAGAVAAFDNRSPNSTATGQLGGLLQASTYIAGLSGGGWLVGSIYINNFSTISDLQHGGDVWQFQNSILEGPPSKGVQLLNTVGYYRSLLDETAGKADAGFETSLTDYWSRALSYQLINATNGGPGYTWNSIALSEGFQNADRPFPVIIANERAPGQTLIPGNTTIYEINPYEFGTFDPTVYGFIPTEYLGTNFSDGSVSNPSDCVRGFDNAGFMMGTSSSLFNQIILAALSANYSSIKLPTFLTDAIQSVANDIGAGNDDIAEYRPNPFYGYNPTGSNGNAGATSLTLVDGGEDNQNIPLHPLIQPLRNIDAILAIDSSADTSTNWPNGSSLVKTYQRSLPINTIANNTAFPSIPDTNTFINLGLNTRPVFFGCDPSNTTLSSSSPSFSSATTHTPPLIIYLPMTPYTAFPNVSTFQLSYSEKQRNSMIQNGYNVATMGNGTADSEWPVCLSCAILSRSWNRTSTQPPPACTRCFERYCWDGSTNETAPEGEFWPTAKLDADLRATSAAVSTRRGGMDLRIGVLMLVAVVSSLLMF